MRMVLWGVLPTKPCAPVFMALFLRNALAPWRRGIFSKGNSLTFSTSSTSEVGKINIRSHVSIAWIFQNLVQFMPLEGLKIHEDKNLRFQIETIKTADGWKGPICIPSMWYKFLENSPSVCAYCYHLHHNPQSGHILHALLWPRSCVPQQPRPEGTPLSGWTRSHEAPVFVRLLWDQGLGQTLV